MRPSQPVPSVSCSAGTFYDGDLGRCVLCAAGTYQDEEGQMACELCPGPEGKADSKVVGARNISECGGRRHSLHHHHHHHHHHLHRFASTKPTDILNEYFSEQQ